MALWLPKMSTRPNNVVKVVSDVRDLEIVGDRDAAEEQWNFQGPFKQMTFASRMQHKIYWGPLKKPIEWSLKTVLAPWAYIASVVYHGKLGSQLQRTERVTLIASGVAIELGIDQTLVKRAARLAKADLATDMVREMTSPSDSGPS